MPPIPALVLNLNYHLVGALYRTCISYMTTRGAVFDVRTCAAQPRPERRHTSLLCDFILVPIYFYVTSIVTQGGMVGRHSVTVCDSLW